MKQIMESITLQDLAIYKFQPNNILMVHKTTKNLYQYYQIPILTPKQRTVVHEHLLQAQFLPTGIIYKKGITNMQNEISKRMRASVKQYYEEQELINTFLPVLLCVQFLHSNNVVHGSICPENIIFDEEGNVLLRDWLMQMVNNKYYEYLNAKEPMKNDDIYALGQIIYQATNLTKFKEETKAHLSFDGIFKKLIPKYSRGYILGIYIMIKKIQKFYPHLQKILKNDEIYIQSQEQLVSIYKKIKGQKQTKPLISPILNYNNFKNLDLMMKIPLTAKKVSKIEDVENKRTFEDIKKKNFDRINRIVQKNSNNEIIKKVDMVLKKMSNMKISNLQENDKSIKKIILKQDVLKFSSPLKRLKTFSKKKPLDF